MSARTIFVITLAVSGNDPIRTLRAALKVLWRRFGLRCLSIREGHWGESR